MDQMMSPGMSGMNAGGQAAMPPGPGGDFMALLAELEQAIAVDAAQGQGNAQQGQLGPNAQRSLAEIAQRREAPAMPNPLSNFNDAGEWQPPAEVAAAAGPRTETLGADLMSGAGTFAANVSDPLGVPSYLTGMVAPGARDAWRGAQEGAPEVRTAGQMLAPLSMIGKGMKAAGSMMKAAPVPTAVAAGGATALASDPAQSEAPVAQAPASAAPGPVREKPIADRVMETLGGAATEAGNAITGAISGSDKFTAMPLEEYRRQNLGAPKTLEDFKAAETERLNKDPAYTRAIEDGMNKRAANIRAEADARAAKAFKDYNPKTEEGRVDQRYKDYVADLDGSRKAENDKPFNERLPSLASLFTYGPAVVGGVAGYKAVSQLNKNGRELASKLESKGLTEGEEAATRLAMKKLQDDGAGLIPLAGKASLASVGLRGLGDATDRYLTPEDSGARDKVKAKYDPSNPEKMKSLAMEYGLNALAGPEGVGFGALTQKAIGKGGPNVAEALTPLDDAGMEAARKSVSRYRNDTPLADVVKPVWDEKVGRYRERGRFIAAPKKGP